MCYIPHQCTGRPHTNKYLSFAYHHSMAHTVAVVRTFMTTANALSSSGMDWEEEKKWIVEALKENGYPPATSTSTHVQVNQDKKWMTRGPEQL